MHPPTSLVSSLKHQGWTKGRSLISISVTAQKGNGAYLLKAGSKRRRKQADIPGPDAQQEMFDHEFSQQSSVIQDLQDKLARAEAESANNKAAADILTDMMNKGDVEQDDSGFVKVSKKRPDGANVMGNMEDLLNWTASGQMLL